MKNAKFITRNILFACCVTAVLSGCVNLAKSASRRNFYMLNTSGTVPPGNLVPTGDKPLLHIQNFSIAAQFARREFVYRTDDDLYESDYFNAFFINPADILHERITFGLAYADPFNILFPGLDQLNADYLLDGYVTMLCGDFRDPKQPKAALGMAIYLLKTTKPNTSVVMGKTYTREIPIAKRTPSLLVQGWNQALTEILTDLRTDISHVLK